MSRRGENKKLVLAVAEVTMRHAYKVLEGCLLLLSDLLVTSNTVPCIWLHKALVTFLCIFEVL